MKKLLSTIIFAALFFNLQLSGQVERLFTPDTFKDKESLNGIPLDIGGHLSTPNELFLLGDKKLMIKELYVNHFIVIYDLNTKEVKRVGTIGRGPGEFISPGGFSAKPDENGAFWTGDLTLGKISEFSLNASLNNEEYRPTQEITFEFPRMCYEPVWTANNNITCLNLNGEGRLSILDSKGNLLRYAGELVPPKKSTMTKTINAFANQARLVARKDGKRLAMACFYFNRIEIYDQNGGLIRRLTGPNESLPIIGIGRGNGENVFVETPKTRITYSSLTADDNFVYCLYSGRTEKEYPDEELYCNQVFVFDWEGNPVKMLQTDVEISKITVDSKGEFLYGTAADYTDIYKFNLNPERN